MAENTHAWRWRWEFLMMVVRLWILSVIQQTIVLSTTKDIFTITH